METDNNRQKFNGFINKQARSNVKVNEKKNAFTYISKITWRFAAKFFLILNLVAH